MKKNILRLKLKQIFTKHKLSKKHSEICANYLIKAELVDAKSHGLARLKMYCDRIRKGLINPKPNIKIKKISSSVSYVNADNSIGFVSADIGVNQAIKNAKKTGIGLVAVKKSGHYGLSSFYAEQAVKKNLMVFCFTNAPPALAPHGAKKSLFGTNPICFGVPTGKAPFILDASTSIINRGKIRRASKLDQKIPFGVALDKNGNIAAGTSTGGMTNKRWGRIGDAPIIGSGTYANNKTCGVSSTGWGEYFIRNQVAYDISAQIEYKNSSLKEATTDVIQNKLTKLGGTGGVVALDKNGNMSFEFNTAGMYRASMNDTGELIVKIYKE